MTGTDSWMSDGDFGRVTAGGPQAAVSGWACGWCGSVNEPGVEFCRQCGADGRSAVAAARPPHVSRFPADLHTRRSILEAMARSNEKYARPFEQGTVALVSLIGTESWSDYGAVVLQMAMLDTLLSIEEKLAYLLKRLDSDPDRPAG